ncbi:MAG TPA: hypothetical protein VHS99_12755 [Chloroflexota bacterium]|nr:hypothetical protein [Chloroflexota bacterium]
MSRDGRWLTVLLVVAGVLLAACAPRAAGERKPEPVRVEPLGETGISRVTLTDRAAQRLGIRTTLMREDAVVRTRAVGGEVVLPSLASAPLAVPGVPAAVVGDLGAVLVRVRLNESDFEAVDRERPVRILPLRPRADGRAGAAAVAAVPVTSPDGAPGPDLEGVGGVLYYRVEGADHGLAAGQRVLVELSLSGGGQRKIVPYDAVIYDLEGGAWIYTSPQPEVFVRHRITVDYIDGTQAVLLEGPPVGTAIVIVGATELYGAESGVGKK